MTKDRSARMEKRKQLIDFEDCERCGVGQLYQTNDADEGFFYDGDPVSCDNCGFEVGKTLCDEDRCEVQFHDEIDVSHYDKLKTELEQSLIREAALVEEVEHLGDSVTDVFEQMIKGNWTDDHQHGVELNLAMINLKEAVKVTIGTLASHRASQAGKDE